LRGLRRGLAVAGFAALLRHIKGYAQLIKQDIDSLPFERYPDLQAAAPRRFGASVDERFSFGVDCLVAGLGARLGEGRTS
jgi:hypothetical protein